MHVAQITVGANDITSHVFYKVKLLDSGQKMIKARIAPHGNKDRERGELKTDSASVQLLG